MGKIHIWGHTTRSTINEGSLDNPQYFELGASDDEGEVRRYWEKKYAEPDFIIAPNKHDSRTNSVVAANVRRILGSNRPIAVMLHGSKRRERVDMCHWLIENDYLPMFPRYMFNEANPSIPLTRLQLMHEMRPILDREPGWIFVIYDYVVGQDQGALDYAKTTQNTWEVLAR